jgi:hypothetical protein
MTKLKMNEELLSLICLIQGAKKLFINESKLNSRRTTVKNQSYTENMKHDNDWKKRTENYYNSLCTHYLKSIGLVKDEICLEAVENFNITNEIMMTQVHELGKFSLSY